MAVELDFDGKSVLVGGANSDIGYAIAQIFSENGAEVVLHSTAKPPAGMYRQVNREPRKREDYAAIVEQALDHLGGLDILVNAQDSRRDVPFATATPEDWEQGMASAKGAMFFTQQAIPSLIASKGSIINIASLLGLMAGPKGSAIQAASAGSIVQITQMSSLRWGLNGVRANCICVGSMEDEGGRSRSMGYDDDIPLQRLTRADDVAGLSLFLASPLARNMSGTVVSTDGGLYGGH